VLLGCALRRSELAALTCEQIQQRDYRWVVADLIGKGGRVRTVPVPAWVKVALDAWLEAAGKESGRLWRSINRGGRLWGEELTEKVVWHVVERYAACAARAAASWSRFSCSSGTPACKRPSATLARGRTMRRTIIRGSGS
jgi:integrase